MSSKKITRWIDINHYKTCLKIVQKYYVAKEEGKKVNLAGNHFLILFAKRFFFIFLNLFRFNKNPYKKYFRTTDSKQFLKRLLGVYKFEVRDLLPLKTFFTPIAFKHEEQPEVSIIIAVHNHLNYTYNCLLSILNNTQNVKYEIILINDFSTDNTSGFLKTVKNITYIENNMNLGFLLSCNKAAKRARGKYLCFLNNDTQVSANWLHHLLQPFIQQNDTGLVGAKLLYPYGLLQEAGGIVNHSGVPANYGKYDDRQLSKYNYLRETDYCSGACILALKSDFEILDGFDERYIPAYYEDTDLCFAIRYKLKKKVYYQPLSQVIHFEGISSGKIVKAGSVKEYQVVNAQKFKEKWASVLSTFPATRSEVEIAGKFGYRYTILFIDASLPIYDKSSGSRRLFELIKIFQALNFNVIFLAHDRQNVEPYFSELINRGIRVLYPRFEHQFPFAELDEVLNNINIAWVSRPELNTFYRPSINKNPNITWVYDTVDLHFIREQRALQLNNILVESAHEAVKTTMDREISLSKQADITIAITEQEKEILVNNGAKKVSVISNVHIPYTGKSNFFDDRSGICFIGGYAHDPNVDAVIWLAKEIMPLVWEALPDMVLTLIGSNPPPEVLALQSRQIKVTGYVEDVTEYFISSRICVAPLRFGAGMKGKIGQSLEFGLPVITTDIGAEGMDLIHGKHALIANNTKAFANEIISLYNNPALWKELAANSSYAIEKYAPEQVSAKLKDIFREYLLFP